MKRHVIGAIAAVAALALAGAASAQDTIKIKIGAAGASSGYEGDGFAILRHPDTAVVAKGLADLVSRVRVELGCDLP